MNERELGMLELKVLLAIIRLKDNAYGASVAELLTSYFPDNQPAIGAIYTTAQRLEEKGYIESKETEPQPFRGGRRRIALQVTKNGFEKACSAWLPLAELTKGLF
jgi:DNA-binding PadR family transcriptional regulator